jgi:hypothetical protein
MATLSIYDTTITQMIYGHQALIALLKKASTHADAASFPSARLTEDMRPLSFQVATASNLAKKVVREVYGIDAGAWEDKEETLDDLIARCEKTISFLQSVKPESIGDKTAETKVTAQLGPNEVAGVSVQNLVLGHTVPNFYFHVTTAYAILRMKGVPLGKLDYLTPFLAPIFAEMK